MFNPSVLKIVEPKDKMQQRSRWLAVQIVLLCGVAILPTGKLRVVPPS